MPALRNAKQEKFAKGLALGLSQVEAYKRAGFKPDDGHAARLAGKGSVAERVAELQEAMARRHQVTQDTLIKELETAQSLAIKEKNPSAHVQATAVKARITGHWAAERKNDRPALLEDVPDGQLDEAITSLAKQAGVKVTGGANGATTRH